MKGLAFWVSAMVPRCTAWGVGFRVQGAGYQPPCTTIGALIIGIGFWGPLYYSIAIIRNHPNSIGNY